MQCTVTEDTSKLFSEVNPLAYFSTKQYNNQFNLNLPQIHRVSDDSGIALTASIYKLVNNYADVFIKLGKPIARDAKNKIMLFNPAKPLPHNKQQKIIERQLKDTKKHLKKYIERIA